MEITNKTIFNASMIGVTKSYIGSDIKNMMKNRVRLLNKRGFTAPIYSDFYNDYISRSDGHEINSNAYYFIISKKFHQGKEIKTKLVPIRDLSKSPIKKPKYKKEKMEFI